MNADVLSFFEKLSKDEKLKKQFLSKPLRKRYALALENSKNKFSEEEFLESMVELCKYLVIHPPKKNDSQKLNEVNLENVSGGSFLTMVDIANLREMGNDYEAFKNASTEDKINFVDTFDDVLNGGAMLGSSIYNLIKTYKKGAKTEKLKDLQEKRKKMEMLLEQVKAAEQQGS